MTDRVTVVKAWAKKTEPAQIMNFSFVKKDQTNTKWVHDSSEFTKFKKNIESLKDMTSPK